MNVNDLKEDHIDRLLRFAELVQDAKKVAADAKALKKLREEHQLVGQLVTLKKGVDAAHAAAQADREAAAAEAANVLRQARAEAEQVIATAKEEATTTLGRAREREAAAKAKLQSLEAREAEAATALSEGREAKRLGEQLRDEYQGRLDRMRATMADVAGD